MNVLPYAHRKSILALSLEGLSMRAIARLSGVAKQTVTAFQASAGKACADFHAMRVRNIACAGVEAESVPIAIGHRDEKLTLHFLTCQETKLVIAYGASRDKTSGMVLADLAARTLTRPVVASTGSLHWPALQARLARAGMPTAVAKRADYLERAIDLYVVHHNFCRHAKGSDATPAMSHGLAHHVWSVEDLMHETLGIDPPSASPARPADAVAMALASLNDMARVVETLSVRLLHTEVLVRSILPKKL